MGSGTTDAGGVEVRVEQGQGTYVVRLLGELDVAGVDEVNEALRHAEASDAGTIVLDLDGLGFIDSTGLATILEASRRDEGRLRVTRGTGHVAEMLRLTGLDKSLPFAQEAE